MGVDSMLAGYQLEHSGIFIGRPVFYRGKAKGQVGAAISHGGYHYVCVADVKGEYHGETSVI
jgi:hypothetical protein